jgi:hypothetical protein
MWECAEGTALPEFINNEDLRQKGHQWSSGYGGDVRSLAATYTPKILLSPQNPGAELSGPVNDTGNIIVDGRASLICFGEELHLRDSRRTKARIVERGL